MRTTGGLIVIALLGGCGAHAPPPLAPAPASAPASAPLADDGRSAWEDWTEARRLLAAAPPRSALNVLSTLLHDIMSPEEEAQPLAEARGLLQENQRAIERAAAGAARPRCVYAAATPRAARDRAALQLQTLGHLVLLRAVVAARSGDAAAAARDVVRVVAMGRLLLGCRGALPMVSSAQSLSELVLRSGRWLARRPLDDGSRARLIAALEAHAGGEPSAWAALQVAGPISLPEVDVPESQTAPVQAETLLSLTLLRSLHEEAARVVDAGLAELLGKTNLAPPERSAAEALRARLGGRRVRTTRKSKALLGELLQAHPRRFSVPETRSRLEAGLATITGLVRARAGGWTDAVTAAGRTALWDLRREPAPSLAVCAYPGYFREGFPEYVRESFTKAENVVGRYLAAVTVHQFAGAVIAELARAQELEAQRAVLVTALALMRYEERRGTLPATLAALPKAGLLRRVPDDPHVGAALRYRPTARKVWSLGKDRKDDGGSAADTVFRLPPRGK